MGESARLHQPFCPSFVPLFVVEAVRATEEYRRIGREMWVKMDKKMCAVLREDDGGQVQEEDMDAPSEGPEGPYKRPSRSRTPEATPGARGARGYGIVLPGVPGVEVMLCRGYGLPRPIAVRCLGSP